ncbi:MAG: M28 family peptidase [Sphingobacteriales bacterium]|nr:M28 family peptidase [Sphingobacteriales bacterium]
MTKEKIKYGLLLIAIAVLVVVKYFLTKAPYPAIYLQRAVLSSKSPITPVRILDSAEIVEDLKFLSSDSCEGRLPGSYGHTLAMDRIIKRMREAGVDSFNNSLLQELEFRRNNNGTNKSGNIIGWIKGTAYPEKYIVISAHYDHLGKTANGEIFHGASDNASGTACVLSMAKYFKQHPQPYSLIFAAFDKEETGEKGSFYFINENMSKPDHPDIKFNLNIDMIARNDRNEIFVCGIAHYPALSYVVKEAQKKTNAKLLMGHDTGENRDNWTSLSDHFPFHRYNIPFLYVGVEDHPDYHKTTDTFEKIDLATYIENCNMVAQIVQIVKL